MASRKEQKDAARQARIAQEQAAAAQAAQRRRMGMLAGVVAIAVIVVVVVVVIASSSGTKKAKNTSVGLASGTKASATYDAVASELKGIPQNGTVLGKPSAPVTIQYFGDLECPICASFTLGEDNGGLPQLISGPVKSGQVKLDYKSFETATGGSNGDRWLPQQTAAYAAGKQNLFWDYAELFYHEQGDETTHYVTESYLQGLAKQIPALNFSQWMTDRKSSAFSTQVTADGKLASSDGLQGTPTLVAVGPKHEEIVPSASGVPTYSEIMSAVKAVS